MRPAEQVLSDLKTAADAAARVKEEQLVARKRVQQFRQALEAARRFTHAGDTATFARAWIDHWKAAAEALRDFDGIRSLQGVPLPDAPGFVVARDLLDELLLDPEKVDDVFTDTFVRCVCSMVEAAEHLGEETTCKPLRRVFDLLLAHFLAPSTPAVATVEPVAAQPEPPEPTMRDNSKPAPTEAVVGAVGASPSQPSHRDAAPATDKIADATGPDLKDLPRLFLDYAHHCGDLTNREAALNLGFTADHVSKLCAKGVLSSTGHGARRRIHLNSVRALKAVIEGRQADLTEEDVRAEAERIRAQWSSPTPRRRAAGKKKLTELPASCPR